MGISAKSNTLLKIILAGFLIVAIRVWHLEVVQREEKIRESEQPKRRTIVQRANRGTIRDRFGIPLAVNKICYNATIYYNQISQIRAISWQEDASGKRVKAYPRREYIEKLSMELGKLLGLDPLRVEDLIHSKASLFPHVPFIIKSGLTEEEHYRLAIMEKDWLGIHAEIGSERYYPRHKSGGEIIGTMGSISSKQYIEIAEEIAQLQKIIEGWEEGEVFEMPFDVAVSRLQELREKAYSIQDLVGKTGIEGKFENELRGFYGKKIFEVDSKGKCLKEQTGGRAAIGGEQIDLSISIELQEFAEALLAENEAEREGRSLGYDPETKERKVLKQPWIKGGSIVAIDPNTGEVLAIASTPRFDPNDFIPSSNLQRSAEKRKNVGRWLENEHYIAAMWDGKMDLSREKFSAKKGFFEESVPLSWEKYLELILPETPMRTLLASCDVKTAIQVQEDFEALLYHSKTRDATAILENTRALEPEAAAVWKRLEAIFQPISSNADRLLFIDLCRLAVYAPAFTDEAVRLFGPMKLEQYRSLNQAFCRLETELKEKASVEFRNTEFKAWRAEHQKAFLSEMRAKEKIAHPYIDYLEEKERELFTAAWNERRLDVLSQDKSFSPELTHTFRSFADLHRPLLGHYGRVRGKEQTEKHLAAAFYPLHGFGYSSSYAFQGTAPQGSIFKLVTAFAALTETKGENPLIIYDEQKRDPNGTRSLIVATGINGNPYPRMYKGGRLPKSASPMIGKIDLAGALEQTSNPYFSLLAGDILKDPEDLNAAAKLFGYGSRTGIDLVGEARGRLPSDLRDNRTGLYSTAIGQHTLLVTPLQSAMMLSAIANGGHLLKPQIVKAITGAKPNREPLSAFEQLAQEELRYLGISFPLFTAAVPPSASGSIQTEKKQIIRSFDFSKQIRNTLFDGMDRVLWTNKGTARPNIIRGLRTNPPLMQEFLSLRGQMVGKTGTAEILFNPFINPSAKPSMYKHIWFCTISFEEGKKWEKPELVVAVYLRYGDAGKEAAPLAAQIIKKWRELKNRS
jgi:cell division protein FtsI/penicillin-binding protein 2